MRRSHLVSMAKRIALHGLVGRFNLMSDMAAVAMRGGGGFRTSTMYTDGVVLTRWYLKSFLCRNLRTVAVTIQLGWFR